MHKIVLRCLAHCPRQMNKACLVLPEISDIWNNAEIVHGEDKPSDDNSSLRPSPVSKKTDRSSASTNYMFLAGAAALAATALIIGKRSA